MANNYVKKGGILYICIMIKKKNMGCFPPETGRSVWKNCENILQVFKVAPVYIVI